MQASPIPTSSGTRWCRIQRSALRALVCALTVAALGGCNGDEDDGGAECVATLPLDCEVAFPPTYQAIFDNVINARCGVTGAGGSCHSAEGKQGGLALAGEAESYEYLLGGIDGKPRVVPGDPECSELVRRIESDDPQYRMPRGPSKLRDTERCAIRQWIADGATRDE